MSYLDNLLNYLLTPAHAFGQSYTLPIPIWMYLFGGGAALIVSFVFIGIFLTEVEREIKSGSSLPKFFLTMVLNRYLVTTVKVIFFFLFLLSIVSGLIGMNYSLLNFNMTYFWIIWGLGLTYFIAIFGNIWRVLNPWENLVNSLEKMLDFKFSGISKYPTQYGYLPALIFYFGFIYFELSGTLPYQLSILLLAYTAINLLGVTVVGKESWFRYGEFFNVLYGIFGSSGIIESKRVNSLTLRAPFIGLLKSEVKHFSLVFFIIFMLSSTAFDGFRESTTWYSWIASILNPFSPMIAVTIYQYLEPLGLLGSLGMFVIVYLLAIYLMKIITKDKLGIKTLSLKFALTLVPIALVYNLAHYYTLLLFQGQDIYRLLSDPFGFDWNLFGTADYRINLNVVDANFIWHSQVALIIIGHIASVWLSHIKALEVFKSRRLALLSQLPMLILMVFYTILGLWILSQPMALGS